MIVNRDKLTTLMITHNMKDAIVHGNRLIMMMDGNIILDIRGEEKKHLTVEDLLHKFEEVSGEEFTNDQSDSWLKRLAVCSQKCGQTVLNCAKICYIRNEIQCGEKNRKQIEGVTDMERKNAWETYDKSQEKKVMKLAEQYRQFISAGKTERECVRLTEKMAREAGYISLEEALTSGDTLKPGDKVYAIHKKKLAGIIPDR